MKRWQPTIKLILLSLGLMGVAQGSLANAQEPSILYRYAYYEQSIKQAPTESPIFEVLAGEIDSDQVLKELGRVDEIRVLDPARVLRSPSSTASKKAVDQALQVVQVASPDANVVREKLDERTEQELRKNYPEWFKKSYRGTFTLVRFFQSGGVAFTSLWMSGSVPLKVAIPSAILAGAISATAQWNIIPLGKWLVSGDLTKAFFKNAAPRVAKSMNKIESYLRWGSLEMSFLALIRGSMILLGVASAPLENEFLQLLSSASLSVWAQGTWDVWIAEEYQRELDLVPGLRSAVESHESNGSPIPPKLEDAYFRIKLVTDRRALLASAASVTLAVGSIVGVSHAEAGLVVMGASRYLSSAKTLVSGWLGRCTRALKN